MQTLVKLIHRTYASYLPMVFQAHYCGMPNGRIYVIYSRFYEIRFGGSGLEFVFAVHKEFKFDYEKEIIILKKKFRIRTPVFAEQVDKLNLKINIIKICRSLNSYDEAINLLNTKAQEIYGLNEAVSNVS